MTFKEKRILKVYKRKLRGYGRDAYYKSVPEIRLQGEWIEEIGFEISDNIQVECKEGQIVITKRF